MNLHHETALHASFAVARSALLSMPHRTHIIANSTYIELSLPCVAFHTRQNYLFSFIPSLPAHEERYSCYQTPRVRLRAYVLTISASNI